MALIHRKQCPKCRVTYEGKVENLYSCEQCGCGYLKELLPLKEDSDGKTPMPRSGSPGLITHTRDAF